MIFSYDAYKRLDRPFTYLATPNKDYIGTIQSRDLQTDLCFNNISETNFKVNKYEDGKLTSHYDDIAELMLVELTYIGWFQITNIERVGNGNNEYVNITALSLENEACSKTLTSFGQLGIETDEQGGLDRYCLIDPADTAHSIMHIWQEKMPSWTIGYIDPFITKEYRTFTEDEVDGYSFLTGKVSETFECIFQFNTFEQTVNAYKLENIGDITSIYLSYDNLIKSINVKSNTSDIKTVLTVSGGDDQGTPLGIIEVNPSGSNQISNFSFYKPLMSNSLQLKLDAYEIEYNNRLNNFTPAVDGLQTLYEELGLLNTKLPNVVTSTNWSEYGLAELNTKYNYYNERMALYIGKTDSTSLTNYNSNRVFRDAVEAELKIRRSQVATKETQIANQKMLCESLTLDIETYLGVELYKELSRYCHYDTFVDDTFVVTSAMTDAEALEMKRELLKMAQDKLAKKCKPQYSIEVDAINFTKIPEFISYSEQLYLGNIMTLDFGDDVLVESRLLKLHINWDGKDDFNMTFSSKNKLDGFEYEFAEIQSLPNKAGTAYGISGTGWNKAKNKTNTFDQYMNSTLDLAKQKLQNSNNQEFTADSTGTLWKKWLDDQNKYSPNQMWGTGNGIYLTQTAWNTVSMAIGEGLYNGQTVYGVWADVLCGRILLGNALDISNSSGTYTINNNGFTATNGIYSVGINPNTPSDILNVKISGVNQLYVDTINKKLVYNGTFTANAISTMNLVVGENVTMGINATINWSQVNGANTNVTNITRDTVTTSFINALNVTAKTVSSDWVYTNNLNAAQINAGALTSMSIKNDDIYIDGSTIQFYTGGAIKRSSSNVWSTSNRYLDNVISFGSQDIQIGQYSGTLVNILNIPMKTINIGYSTSPTYSTVYIYAGGGFRLYGGSSYYLYIGQDGRSLIPSTTWDLGVSSLRFGTGYFNDIDIGGMSLSPTTIYSTSSYYATLNTSREFVPNTSSTSYPFSIGNSSYPWDKGYFRSLYINGVLLETFTKTSINTLYNSASHYITFNSSGQLVPNTTSTSYSFDLGSSSYSWDDIYVKNIYHSSSSGSIGFFGTTPTSKKSVSKISSTASATAPTNATKINEILTALAAYGLLTST